MRSIVIIESPYAGELKRNLEYLRDALRDSLMLGEAPFASHAIYPGALNDGDENERKLGIEAGFAFRIVAARTAVYMDLGISSGMKLGIEHAERNKFPVVYRSLPKWVGL